MTPADFRAIRLALGLSAKKMAEALGVCERSIWYWESGTRRVPKPIANLLAFLRKP